MNIICSPSGIINPFRPGQGVMDIVGAGFTRISLELDMCCSSYELEHLGQPKPKLNTKEEEEQNQREFAPISEVPSEMRRFFQKMIAQCQRSDLTISVVLAPYLPGDTKRTASDILDKIIEIDIEAIRYCQSLGCGYIVVRPLPFGMDIEEKWEINREFFLRLGASAKENHVMILLQNLYQNKNGGIVRGMCSDGQIAARWIDELNKEAGEEIFGFCMDVGICSLCGQDMNEFASALGNRIKAVIFRDCDGQRESSMLPFTSVCFGQPRTDWLGLIRGLRQCSFDGEIILNMFDTAASFSPLLRPVLMNLARVVAEYLKWQVELENLLKKYDSIVLFGAGNMCRNYMKCYGEKYPPLFTCDNNEKVWGTRFCGLEVRPPDALRSIPENCGVFICNIYYREIEKQLKDMGIMDIEFFNDEYMPSFHFDRLRGV